MEGGGTTDGVQQSLAGPGHGYGRSWPTRVLVVEPALRFPPATIALTVVVVVDRAQKPPEEQTAGPV